MNQDTPTIPRDRTNISDSPSNQIADVSVAANSRENNPLKSRTDTKEPEVLDLSVPIEKPSAARPPEDDRKPSETDRRNERPEEKRPEQQSDEPKHPIPDLGPRPDPGADAPTLPVPPGENPYAQPGDNPNPQSGGNPNRRPGEPRVETVTEGGRTWTESTWTDGPNAGMVQRDYPDGSRLVFKPHPDGGRIATFYDRNGNMLTATITHKPDPDGSVRVTHSDLRNPDRSYNAIHRANGSLEVDFGDGSRLRQRSELSLRDRQRTTHTTMTGPNPHQNFSASETFGADGGRSLDIRYNDGSRYQLHRDGREETTGSRGGLGVLDRLMGSASDRNMITRLQLISAFYMTQSRDLAEVRHRYSRGTR